MGANGINKKNIIINKQPIMSEKFCVDDLIINKKIEGSVYSAINKLCVYYLSQDDKTNPLPIANVKPAEMEKMRLEKIDRVYNQIMNVIKFSTTEYEQIRQEYSIKKLIKDKIVNGYKTIVNIEYIPIYQEDIDFISSIEDIDYQKLLFSILCYVRYSQIKYNNDNLWCNYKLSLYFKSAGLKHNQKQQYILLRRLIELNLIKSSFKIDKLSFYALFMEQYTPQKEIYKVTSFDELGMTYLELIGEPIIECVTCHKKIKNPKNEEWVICNKCKRKEEFKEWKTMKKIICCECGKSTLVSRSNKTQVRCKQCQANRTRENKTLKQRLYRQK